MTAFQRWIFAGLMGLLAAGVALADSGRVWSLAPDGSVTGVVGTWQRQGPFARFQWLGSQAGLDVNLQQLTAGSTPDIYVFLTYAQIAPRRQSGYFSPARPLIGPSGRPIYPGRSATDPLPVLVGELALDVRTFTGESIGGAWRSMVGPINTRGAIVPQYGPWQPLRIVIENP